MINKILVTIAILTSSVVFAQDAIETLDNEIISEIVANKNTCVVGCSKDRIYLNPQRIFPTEQGLYLNLNDADYVLLPALHSDSQGCFVPVVQIFNLCPGCDKEYFINCTNPECPLVQRKQERERDREHAKEERKREKARDKEKKRK